MGCSHAGGAGKVFGCGDGEVERVGYAVDEIEVGADENGVYGGLCADTGITEKKGIVWPDCSRKKCQFFQEGEHGP